MNNRYTYDDDEIRLTPEQKAEERETERNITQIQANLVELEHQLSEQQRNKEALRLAATPGYVPPDVAEALEAEQLRLQKLKEAHDWGHPTPESTYLFGHKLPDPEMVKETTEQFGRDMTDYINAKVKPGMSEEQAFDLAEWIEGRTNDLLFRHRDLLREREDTVSAIATSPNRGMTYFREQVERLIIQEDAMRSCVALFNEQVAERIKTVTV